MKELVEEEEALIQNKGHLPSDEALIAAKKDGFSDKYLSQILDQRRGGPQSPHQPWRRRGMGGVHVSATPDRAYYYSTYNGEDKTSVSTEKPQNHDLRAADRTVSDRESNLITAARMHHWH